MGIRSEVVFQNLRTRIEEENSIPGRRRAFSKGTMIEVPRLLNEGYRSSILAGQLGISESVIGKWKKQEKGIVFQPKKLKVLEDFEERNLLHPEPAQSGKREVQLPNGVVLETIKEFFIANFVCSAVQQPVSIEQIYAVEEWLLGNE